MRDKFRRIRRIRGFILQGQRRRNHPEIIARINRQTCIGCDLCYIACWDGAHQCIHMDRVSGPIDGQVELHEGPSTVEWRSRTAVAVTPVSRKERAIDPAVHGPYPTALARIPRVDETECVGCNLCSLVCPVDECITMKRVDTGLPSETWDQRTNGARIQNPNVT